MKTIVKLLLIFTVVFFTYRISAQWGTDVRLTNDPGSSYLSEDRSIAASGNFIHVVWQEHRHGDPEIYYKRSTNRGVSWESDVRITNAADYSGAPCIGIYQSFVHIIWVDQRAGAGEIYYRRSTNNGATWENEIILSSDPNSSFYPSAYISGSGIVVTWEDNRDGNWEIYSKRSVNSGSNWSADLRLTNDTASQKESSASVSGSNIHVVWKDSRHGQDEIYYRNSTNFGVSWQPEVRLTNDVNISSTPCVETTGQTVCVFWRDNRDGNAEIYFKKSTDNGNTFETDLRLTNAANNSILPSAAIVGQFYAVVWVDLRTNYYKNYYKFSTDGGLNWSNDLLISPVSNTGSTGNPSLIYSDTALHVCWNDNRDGNEEVYYKKNALSVPVGIVSANNEIPLNYSLTQNYPNPFNPITNIEFSIPNAGITKLVIYDALGREVETLVNSELNPGTYSAVWDASKYNSGVYFYRLTTGNFTETKKMILVK